MKDTNINSRRKKKLKIRLFIVFKKVFNFLFSYSFANSVKDEIFELIKNFLVYIISPKYQIKKKPINKEFINFCKSNFPVKYNINRNKLFLNKFVSILNKFLFK